MDWLNIIKNIISCHHKEGRLGRPKYCTDDKKDKLLDHLWWRLDTFAYIVPILTSSGNTQKFHILKKKKRTWQRYYWTKNSKLTVYTPPFFITILCGELLPMRFSLEWTDPRGWRKPQQGSVMSRGVWTKEHHILENDTMIQCWTLHPELLLYVADRIILNRPLLRFSIREFYTVSSGSHIYF